LPASARAGGRTGRAWRRRCGNIGKPQCTRTVPTGRLTVAGKKGPNSITFKGRLDTGVLLAPATYVITLTPLNGTGLAGASHKLTFTVAG